MFNSFNEFQEANKKRCVKGFGHPVDTTNEDWPWQNWAICIAGEAGEFANLVKKVIRGDFSLEAKREELLKELADIITYSDLAISSLGGNTAEVVSAKFEEVSNRIGYSS